MAAASTRPRLVVVGSANVDLTTFVDRIPDPGETLFGKAFDLGFGGKGANQAVAAYRCGADVCLVARVGSDLFGSATLDHYASVGLDTRHLRVVDGASSGVAPIFVEADGQNRILVVKGANDHVGPIDVDRAADAIASADCVVLQLEIPIDTVYHTVALAARHRVPCILNPAPGRPLDLPAVASVAYLVPNESEAATLVAMPVRTRDETVAAARRIIGAGPRRVIVTRGAEGAVVAGPDAVSDVPAFRVDATDTSGAGDAFIGSLATFLAEGEAEDEALLRASLYAALSTTRVGTQKSFPERESFEAEWRVRRPTQA